MAAASVVVTAQSDATIPVFGEEERSDDPGLNPYHPNHNINVPSI
jgi:hypothetical protein